MGDLEALFELRQNDPSADITVIYSVFMQTLQKNCNTQNLLLIQLFKYNTFLM